MTQSKIPLFNNCVGRNHADVYSRSDAFFDLDVVGHQANQATEVTPGESCLVAQAANAEDEIRFDRYTLKEIVVLKDKYKGTKGRVFCGDLESSEVIPRSQACEHPEYREVFNSLTHFKRTSVVYVDA